MVAQQAIQNILNERLTEIRLRNSSYSLRAFSQKLGIPASALSEIINGKRRVSKKFATRIADRLLISPKEKLELLSKFPEKRNYASKDTSIKKEALELTMDHFHTISDWYHFAILSLAETETFKSDPAWIARRLRISTKDAVRAIERLLRLEMLKKDPSGDLKATGISYHTTDEVANLSLRRSHVGNLELARDSLERDPIDKRDFTALTMAIDPARLSGAKKLIRKFRQELSQYLESGKKEEVYKICIQLFPLTEKEE